MVEEKGWLVDFEPLGLRVRVVPGETLLAAARRAGVQLASICGGIGACDGCLVRLIAGALTEPTIEEEALFSPADFGRGTRLACQAMPLSDVRLYVPPESLTASQRLQLEGPVQLLKVDPAVKAFDIELDPPSPGSPQKVVDWLLLEMRARGVEQPIMPSSVLPLVAQTLEDNNWRVRLALRDGELIGLFPPGTPLLGLALDIGTTSIAAYLVELASGRILAKDGALNPQIAYGEDVISRIAYANSQPDGPDELRSGLLEVVGTLIRALCEKTQCRPAHIVDAVVVGNTAMHHIFCGLPLKQLGEAPYTPAVYGAIKKRAAEAGLNIAPGAMVYLPPNIAGYVGADHAAALAAALPQMFDEHSPETALVIDIGTNTEVSLVHQGVVCSCSCASGPAFEGAHIRQGMRAAPGAIERVQLIGGEIRFQTIDNLPPAGICGSGILDAVALMVLDGAVNTRGALLEDSPRVRENKNGEKCYVLAESEAGIIGVNRRDVAEIQLAKSAIRTGIEILLHEAGIDARMIHSFIVAGAFGNYIDVGSAMQIGLFPDIAKEKFQQVGNAAGMGAVQLLLSREQRRAISALAKRIRHVDLTTHPAFKPLFMRYMAF